MKADDKNKEKPVDKKVKTKKKNNRVQKDIVHVKNEEKYKRGTPVVYKKVKDAKLRAKLYKEEQKNKEAAQSAARAEKLLQEEVGYLEADELEKTYNFKQEELKKHVDVNTASKIFSLDLPSFGGYRINYTRNGRHLLIGGHKGHIAAFDWQSGKLHFETHVNESVRDIQWLHNETMLAVAQKKYVYIYDNNGLEIHRVKDLDYVDRLDFLPYHYLLTSIGTQGQLKYLDTSMGKIISVKRTKLGPCNTMTHNPYNAVVHLGHQNGTVTLWSPSMNTPLVKMLCHRGPVKAVAVDKGGHYMATAGADGQMKLWDIRTFGVLQEYYTPKIATSLSISDNGLLSVGWNTRVQIWKDAFKTKQTSPYMNHMEPGSLISNTQFVPYEDVLGIGHQNGISSIVVPGAGEANFDSMVVNPFQTKKQRQETEVHSLLNKLQPDMIVLDPTIMGKVRQ